MDSDWAVSLRHDNNRGRKYPLQERTEFNPGSINLFITICRDYDEEKYDNDDKKDTQPIFRRGLPSRHPA